jgi:hypothetical protein
MLNAILNGALGETSSRSGSNTTTTEYVTLPNESKRVTVEEWNTIYKPVESLYVDAYGYAYSNNIKQPKWDDVVLYREAVVDSYKNGKVFNADEYLAQQQQQQQQGQQEPQQEPQQQTVKTPTQPEVVIPETVVPSGRTGTNESRSGNNTPLVTVAPSEEKGSSLLLPGIILALGVIGAIALTSKSKKRR